MASRFTGISRKGSTGGPLSQFNHQKNQPASQAKAMAEQIETSSQEDSVMAPPMASSDTDSDGLPSRGDITVGTSRKRTKAAHPESDSSPPPSQAKRNAVEKAHTKKPASEGSDSDCLSSQGRQDREKTKKPEEEDPPWMKQAWMKQDDPVARNKHNKRFGSGYSKNLKNIRPPMRKAGTKTRSSPEPPTFKKRNLDPDSSPDKSRAKLKKTVQTYDDSSEDEPRAELKKSSQTRLPHRNSPRKKFRKTMASSRDDDAEDQTQVPVFKAYTADKDVDRAEFSEPFQEVDLPDVLELSDSDSPLSELSFREVTTTIQCPVCGNLVEKDVYTGFSNHSDLSIIGLDQQLRFCERHRKHTARQTWDEKGWPDIKWSQLNSRFEEHNDFLEGVLLGQESHFRSLLDDNVREGKNRTVRKAVMRDGRFTPGYYGLRGMRAMSDYIVDHFSQLLRKQAVGDKLVSSRGHTGYVQAVMVPELAVRLIMADMAVDAEKARNIMSESAEIGELLNDEIKDVVLRDESESDSDGFESI